jgi:hypothetical protein
VVTGVGGPPLPVGVPPHVCRMHFCAAAPASELVPHSLSTRHIWKPPAVQEAAQLVDPKKSQHTRPLAQSLASLHFSVVPPVQAPLGGTHSPLVPASLVFWQHDV